MSLVNKTLNFQLSSLPILPTGLGIVLLLLAGGCGQRSSLEEDRRLTVHISGRSFKLELALTPEERYRGLSDRPFLAPDAGMLFVFPYPQEVTFVMRRCLIPIDVIFLDAVGRVDSWYQMAVEPYDQPEEALTPYRSRWPVQFAIELPGGTVDQLNLRTGQKISLPLEELKRLAR